MHITSKEISHKISKFEEDSSGLGRWVWTTMDGKQEHKTCSTAGHRP